MCLCSVFVCASKMCAASALYIVYLVEAVFKVGVPGSSAPSAASSTDWMEVLTCRSPCTGKDMTCKERGSSVKTSSCACVYVHV